MPNLTLPRRASAWLVALFFLALAAVGLFTSADYGQPWDEPWEQDILRLNLNQYTAALNLPGQLAPHSSMPWPATGVIADSVEKDHGECAYYPAFWLMLDNGLSATTRMTLWHAYTWLLFMAGVAALWLVCRRLGLSRLLSSVSALFLVLSPRMFAEGHYNNKDVVLLSLVLVTLWLALRLMEKPGIARALLFSMAGAATANTKVIGLLIWGLCALAVLVRQIAGRCMSGRAWLAAVIALFSFVAFYALLTPALWADPLGYLKYVLGNAAGFSRWENFVLFRGSVFHLKNTQLPMYYLPYMIVVTTPLWLLALICLGQGFAIARFGRLRRKPFADDTAMALLLCTLLWLLPFLYDVIARPTIYNGWRHFYFLYGPMLALAAYGFKCMGDILGKLNRPIYRRVGAGALGLCMALTGTQIALSHPNQYTYYNALVGMRADLGKYLELDYWNVSVLATLRKVVAQVSPGEQKTITGSDYNSQTGLTSAYALLTPEEQTRLRILPQNSLGAKYVMVNPTYAVLAYWQPKGEVRIAAETRSFAQPLSVVYERIPKQ